MIFMHGNGELADYWVREFEPPRAWGVGGAVGRIPGYGRAPGSPSEKSITEAARAAVRLGAADPDRSRADRAYGRSLGGGAAARLAVDRKVAALILESAFTSVADFAARFLAPSFLIRDRFDNRKSARLISRAVADDPWTAEIRSCRSTQPGTCETRSRHAARGAQLRPQRLPKTVEDDRAFLRDAGGSNKLLTEERSKGKI